MYDFHTLPGVWLLHTLQVNAQPLYHVYKVRTVHLQQLRCLSAVAAAFPKRLLNQASPELVQRFTVAYSL